MKKEWSEHENEVITHVLIYGYPSEDSEKWAVWHEVGITNARQLAADTERALTESDKRHREGYQ